MHRGVITRSELQAQRIAYFTIYDRLVKALTIAAFQI
jgi:hypothetical protein